MPKLPILSGQAIIRALEQMGFVQVRQRGSHVVLKKRTDNGDVGCVVPLHKEVAVGTLRSILKQAGVDSDEFIKKVS